MATLKRAQRLCLFFYKLLIKNEKSQFLLITYSPGYNCARGVYVMLKIENNTKEKQTPFTWIVNHISILGSIQASIS